MSGAKELLDAVERTQRTPPLGEGRGATPEGELAARIALALEQIEAAQRLLGAAAANLSPIIGAATIWEATGKLYDRVHNHWRRLAYNTHRGWKLDGTAMSRFGCTCGFNDRVAEFGKAEHLLACPAARKPTTVQP